MTRPETFLALTDALKGRAYADEQPTLLRVLSQACDDAPATPPADVAARLAGLLDAAGDPRADLSGTADEIAARYDPTHPSLVTVTDLICHVQDEAGGDHWGIAAELRTLADIFAGAARDLAAAS